MSIVQKITEYTEKAAETNEEKSYIEDLEEKRNALMNKLYEMSFRQAELSLDEDINDEAITAINKAMKQIKMDIDFYTKLVLEEKKRASTDNAIMRDLASPDFRNIKVSQTGGTHSTIRLRTDTYTKLADMRKEYKMNFDDVVCFLLNIYDSLNEKNPPATKCYMTESE